MDNSPDDAPETGEPGNPPGELHAVQWQAQTTVGVYGIRITLAVEDEAHLARLEQHLPHGAVIDASGVADRTYAAVLRATPAGPEYRLFADGRRIAESTDLRRVARSLGADSRHFVAIHARERIFIHAGVVACGAHAILIPGRSMSGKTTLVAELLRAGATYYSDEYAVLDAQGRVHPFAKPLSIRTVDGAPQRLVPAADFGSRSGAEPLRVAGLLSTRYVPGTPWEPQPMTGGQVALTLLDNAVAAQPRFHEVRQVISAVVAGGVRAWRGDRGEARDVARWTLQQFEMPERSS